MQRWTSTVAVATVVLLAAGCGSPDRTPDRAPQARASQAQAPQAQTPQARAAGLELPAKARVLVPETSGSSDLALKRFTPGGGVYTVYARCSGKGRVTIVDAERPGDDPSRVACGSVVTVGRVYSEAQAQALRMRVSGGTATWTVAVVDGEYEA